MAKLMLETAYEAFGSIDVRGSGAAERRLAAIVESSDDAILGKTPDGVITSWNPAAERVFGYAAGEAIGRRISIIVPFERSEEERRLLEDALRGLPVSQHETQRLRNDGRLVDVSLSVSPIRYPEGGGLGVSIIARDVTERKRADRALREATERFETAFQNAPLGMALVGLDGCFLQVNRPLCRILGRTEAELLQSDGKSLIHPADVEHNVRQLRSLLAGEIATSDTEKRYLRPDGTSVWASSSVSLVRDPDGRPRYFVGQVQDITVRREAEDRLRASERQMAEAQRRAQVGSWELDLRTGENRASAELQRIWGLAADSSALEGETLLRTVHPDDREELRTRVERLTERLEPYEISFRIVRPDGSTRVVETRGEAITDDTGRPVRVAGTTQDVTDRRRGEEALRTSEARLQAILDNIPAAVWVKDLEGHYLLVNRAVETLVGRPGEEMLGRTDHDLLPPAEAAEFRAQDLRLIEAKKPLRVQDTLEVDGERRILLTDKFLLHDGDGRPHAVCGIATDITERDRVEQELRDSRVRLREAQRMARLGSWELRIADGRAHLSEEVLDILGMDETQSERHVDALLEHLHPDDLPGVREVLDGVRPGHFVPIECRFVRSDGSILWLHAEGAVEWRDGAPDRIVGTVQDVTERRRGEAEFRRLSARNEVILRSAGEGIFGVDAQGRTTFANPAAGAMVGWDPRDLVGRHLHEAVHHSHADGRPYPWEDCSLMRVLGGGDAQLVQDEVLWTKDGRPFPVELLATPIKEGPHVVGAVVTFRNISERKRTESQLQYLADHDSLTGFYNRRRFDEEVERQVAVSGRHGGGALLLLDLDEFKDVNDSLGHAAGDELLKQVSVLLRDRLRKIDVLARLGGDEFALLLPDAGAAEAQNVARELLRVLREGAAVVAGQQRPARISTSIGIALFDGEPAATAADMLMKADLALYEAKEAGRDRFAMYTPARHAEVEARLSQTQRIRRALDEGLFVLHCQPIVRVATGHVARYELLLRMLGHDGELVGPAGFLPTAERMGLVQEIDRWVVSQAIGLIDEHRREGRELCLEVNLSGRSISDPAVLDFIEAELLASDIDPANLIFEITETAAIASMDAARHLATSLNRLGAASPSTTSGPGSRRSTTSSTCPWRPSRSTAPSSAPSRTTARTSSWSRRSSRWLAASARR